MSLSNLLLCVLFAACLPIGQVLFKGAALVAATREGWIERILLNPTLYVAFGWYAATALLWFHILTREQLGSAYLFSIAGSALVPLAAWVIFQEPVSPRFWLGYAVMLAGFYLALTGRNAG